MNKKGFSFVESLVVIFIIGVATTVSITISMRYKWRQELLQSARQLESLIRKTQNDALTGVQYTNSQVACGYGIHLSDVDTGIIEFFMNGYANGAQPDCISASPSIPVNYQGSTSRILSNLFLENTDVIALGQPLNTVYFELPFGAIRINNSGAPLSNSAVYQIALQHRKTNNRYYICIYGTGKIASQETSC